MTSFESILLSKLLKKTNESFYSNTNNTYLRQMNGRKSLGLYLIITFLIQGWTSIGFL